VSCSGEHPDQVEELVERLKSDPNVTYYGTLPMAEEGVLATIAIPKEIVDAACKVEDWFKRHGIEHWALMGIQSRER